MPAAVYYSENTIFVTNKINADGTPKVVYHGMGAEFFIFDITKIKEADGGVVLSIPKKRSSLATTTSKSNISQESQAVNSKFSAPSSVKVQKLESENARLKEVNDILKRFFRQTCKYRNVSRISKRTDFF